MAVPVGRASSRNAFVLLLERLREEQRAGTISLAGLPRVALAVCLLAVVALVAGVALVLPNLVAGWWPEPIARIPGNLLAEETPGRVSVPLYLAGLAILTAASAALGAMAAATPSRWQRVLVSGGLGVLAISLGGAISNVADMTQIVLDVSVNPDPGLVPAVRGVASLELVVGAVLLARLPLDEVLGWYGGTERRGARAVGWLRRSVTVGAILAALPFAGAIVVVAVLEPLHVDVESGIADASWPATVDGAGLAAGTMGGIVDLAARVVGLAFLWQSVVTARAVRRQLGTAASIRVARRPHLLFALLGAKAVWLVAGYAGLLVLPLVPGNPDAWAAARGDDPLGILAAILIVAALLAWLWRGARPAISDRGVGRAIAFFAIGFTLPFAVASVLLLFQPVANLADPVVPQIPDGLALGACLEAGGWRPQAIDLCLVRAVGDLEAFAPIVTWVAGAAVALIAARRGSRAIAVAFGAVVLWSAPAAVDVVLGFMDRAPDALLGRPELITVDALLTIAVGVLAVWWWQGRQVRVPPRTLTLLLVVSTLVATVGGVVPPEEQPIVIGLILLAGTAYDLLFESESVNEAGLRRLDLLPRTLGLQLLGIGILASTIALDDFSGDGADLAVLFVPPVIALLVLAEVSRHRRPARVASGRTRAPGRLLRWATVGALAAAAIVGAGRLVPAGPSGATDTSRYAAFLAHVDVARASTARAVRLVRDLSASGDTGPFIDAAVAFDALVTTEESWVAGMAPAACFEAEASRWRGLVADLDAFRDALTALLTGSDPNPDIGGTLGRYLDADRDLLAGTSPCQTVLPGPG